MPDGPGVVAGLVCVVGSFTVVTVPVELGQVENVTVVTAVSEGFTTIDDVDS